MGFAEPNGIKSLAFVFFFLADKVCPLSRCSATVSSSSPFPFFSKSTS